MAKTRDIHKDSEPAKHLRNNPNHCFNRKTIIQDSTNYRQRKNLEASITFLLLLCFYLLQTKFLDFYQKNFYKLLLYIT